MPGWHTQNGCGSGPPAAQLVHAQNGGAAGPPALAAEIPLSGTGDVLVTIPLVVQLLVTATVAVVRRVSAGTRAGPRTTSR